MKRLLALLALAGCATPPPAAPGGRPMRIVSLDYCADQYVLELVERDRILAVSPDAGKAFSYKRAAAAGVRQVPPRAEHVLALRPDLVVRSYGGGPGAEAFFARAGVPVLQIGYADDLPAVRRALVDAAMGLGEPEKGDALAAEFDARLARLPHLNPSPEGEGLETSALYITPGGVTSGPGTLVHEMLTAAGLTNFQREPGWRPLPLERMAYQQPDIVAAAFFDAKPVDPWSAARHPIARAAMRERPTVRIEGAWTACGGWFVLDAIEALAKAR